MAPLHPERQHNHNADQKLNRLNIIRQAFAYMTRKSDPRAVLAKSVIVAGAAVFFTVPYFIFLTESVIRALNFGNKFQFGSLFFSQLFLLFIACLLSALAGFSFSQRLELPGFGDWAAFVRSFWNLFALALTMVVLSYFIFDRHLIKLAPQFYPQELLYLLALPLKRAFTDEIILRLGLVTISVLLFKSKLFGVIAVSALFPFLSVKYFQFIGVVPDFNYLFIISVLLSFATHLIAGYLFIVRGLLYSMMFNFILGLKFIIIAYLY